MTAGGRGAVGGGETRHAHCREQLLNKAASLSVWRPAKLRRDAHALAGGGLSAVRDTELLNAPAVSPGGAAVHVEQLRREQRGLVAARARAQLQHGVALLRIVLRDERHEDLLLQRRAARDQRVQLLLRHLTQLLCFLSGRAALLHARLRGGGGAAAVHAALKHAARALSAHGASKLSAVASETYG